MVQIKPIQGIPALLLSAKEKVLCISDLHLGYELDLQESGFNIPDQTNRIAESIFKIEEGDRLLILGDVKHTIPFTTKFEFIRLSKFFNSLFGRFSSITVVTGNHDGALKESLPKEVEIISSKGMIMSSIGFAHGHSWPSEEAMKARRLVIGHIHPSLRLRDRLGSGNSIKCWLRGTVHKEQIEKKYSRVEVEEVVVMPAYNPLLTGTPVNERSDYGLSPLLRSGFMNLLEQRAYTLDGIDLGIVSDLMVRRKGKSNRLSIKEDALASRRKRNPIDDV